MNVMTERTFWDFVRVLAMVFLIGSVIGAIPGFLAGYFLGRGKRPERVSGKTEVYGRGDAVEAAIERQQETGMDFGSFQAMRGEQEE